MTSSWFHTYTQIQNQLWADGLVTLILPRFSYRSITLKHPWWVSGRWWWHCSCLVEILCFILSTAHLSSLLFSTVVFLLQKCGQRLHLLSPKLNGQYWFARASDREDSEVNVGTLSSWNYQGLIVPGLSRKCQRHELVSRSDFLHKPKQFNA